jgi:hypothetical protein
MARRSAHRELNEWLDHHGYRNAHAAPQKTAVRAHSQKKVDDERDTELADERPHEAGLRWVSGRSALILEAHGKARRTGRVDDQGRVLVQFVSGRTAHAARKGGVAETTAAIRATGASVKRVDGEWQVNVPGGTEATTYFTDNAEDALATARAMMARFKPKHARMAAAPLDETTAELLRDASYGTGEYVARVATAKPATDLQASPTLAVALEKLRRQSDRTMGLISKALAYSKAMPSGKRDHANLIRLIKGGFVKVRKINSPPPEGSTAWRDARYGNRHYELYLADES